MILADTSIWVEHLNRGNKSLSGHLEDQSIVMHPFVIGELALGNLHNRKRVLSLLQAFPAASVASDVEVLRFIDERGVAGAGIGYVDVHLLAATALTPNAGLWTKDKRLHAVAIRLGLAGMR